jgi:predicted protein tyrosine phosphatase
MNVLFICSRNQWRSPTAENIYKNHSDLHVKSAGTAPAARIKINEKMVLWADIIFVMEKKHKQRIMEKFSEAMTDKQLVILDIPDEYELMDEVLIEEIKAKVSPYLEV